MRKNKPLPQFLEQQKHVTGKAAYANAHIQSGWNH